MTRGAIEPSRVITIRYLNLSWFENLKRNLAWSSIYFLTRAWLDTILSIRKPKSSSSRPELSRSFFIDKWRKKKVGPKLHLSTGWLTFHQKKKTWNWIERILSTSWNAASASNHKIRTFIKIIKQTSWKSTTDLYDTGGTTLLGSPFRLTLTRSKYHVGAERRTHKARIWQQWHEETL